MSERLGDEYKIILVGLAENLINNLLIRLLI